MKKIFQFFSTEMKLRPELYVDTTCNQVNLTRLAESYLQEHPEIKMESPEEEEIFIASSEWFDQWEEKYRYNP